MMNAVIIPHGENGITYTIFLQLNSDEKIQYFIKQLVMKMGQLNYIEYVWVYLLYLTLGLYLKLLRVLRLEKHFLISFQRNFQVSIQH